MKRELANASVLLRGKPRTKFLQERRNRVTGNRLEIDSVVGHVRPFAYIKPANDKDKLPGPPAKPSCRAKPGWRPRSASSVGYHLSACFASKITLSRHFRNRSQPDDSLADARLTIDLSEASMTDQPRPKQSDAST